ncbi:MAG TPA: class I SAM-dependent RNA methyltransferase [Candidatus Krumholzibacteria bacterium]|nr:class I SAM-dependent RNA methyltransferase [Candidatus Krumholzibacteria bacterium]
MSQSENLVEVSLHGMAHGGEAVGRLDDGRAVFVAGGIPGEKVRIRLLNERKRWARGELVEVLEKSEDRVEAPCPYFGECGGCQWQHISLARQRVLKREIVEGQIEHLGGMESASVEETRASGEADGFGYRNHAIFAVDAEGHTAYHRARSRELVAIDRCLLLHPLLRESHEALPPLPGLRRLELRAGVRTGQRLIMATGEVDPAPVEEAAARGVPLRGPGQGEITEMVHTERYRISSKSFFQVNTDGAEVLVDLIMEMLDPSAEDQVLDAYAGVGLFTLPLARKSARVYAVERNRAALRDLRHLVKGLPVHIVGVDITRAAEQLPSAVDLAVADPPREGLGEENVVKLAAMRPRRLALVSCDPASLARDLKSLRAAGYILKRAVPVDLFPHTYHVETVALLERA